MGLREIYFGLKESQIFGNTYIYDLDDECWVKVSELSLFDLIDFNFDMGDEEEMPNFIPPPVQFNPTFIKTFHESAELFQLFIKKEQKNNLILKQTCSDLENIILEEKKLKEYFSDESEAKEALLLELKNESDHLSKEVINLRNIVSHLENQSKLAKKENLRDDEFEELVQINKKLEKKNSLATIKEKEYLNEIGQLKKMLENLKNGAKKFVLENEKLKKTISRHTENSQALTKELQENQGLKEKMERELQHNKTLILKIKKDQQKKTNDQIKRLTGESFEISNQPIWEYKQSGKTHGPYSFENVLDLKKQNKINEKTLLRNIENKTNWSAMNDYFEFSAPFEMFSSEENGLAINRYFMKRGSIRAPFYDMASLIINDIETKGYCTSISLGGCFIELTRLKEGTFIKEQKATLMINHETLGQAISCSIIIKNVSLNRPKGVGVMFEGLDNESRLLIEKFVNQTLNKNKKPKAA